MKKLILKVRDKNKVHSLSNFCNIIFVSRFTNVVTIEISERVISRLKSDPNIISFRESDEGKFQPRFVAVN